MYGQLAGGAIGAGLGAAAGYYNQKNENNQITRLKGEIRQGIWQGEAETARSVAGTMTTPEWLTATNFVRSFYGIKGVDQAEMRDRLTSEFGPQSIAGFMGQKLSKEDKAAVEAGDYSVLQGEFRRNRGAGKIMSAGEVLDSRFADSAAKMSTPNATAQDVLSTEFSKGLNQALASRGLSSAMAGAGAEASGLAGLRARMQMEMLPNLFDIAQAPAKLRQQYEVGNLQRGVFYTSGGGAAYGQAQNMKQGSTVGAAFAGAAAGWAMGSGIGQGIDQGALGMGLYGQQQPTPAVAPQYGRGNYVEPGVQPTYQQQQQNDFNSLFWGNIGPNGNYGGNR